MNKKVTLFMVLVLFIGIANRVNATTIIYDLNNLGGSTWEYNYTVQNDSLSIDIEEFTVWFDYTLYENLAVTSPLLDWDEIEIQPDTFIPDDGFYDALALVSGIAPGESKSGFSVSFDWLGNGVPGSQFFDIVDPNTFEIIESGNQSIASDPNPVPEPSTFLFMAIGFVSLVFFRKKLKASKATCPSSMF